MTASCAKPKPCSRPAPIWPPAVFIGSSPSREIRVNETLDVWQGQTRKTIIVRGLSDQRGSATIAQALYEETPQSVASREQASEQRRLSPEPAHSIANGRPTKRDRRALQTTPWDDRWSASIDS